MAKEYAKSFYKSKEWIKCRNSYITFVHGLCERCGKPGKIVHHKKKITPMNIIMSQRLHLTMIILNIFVWIVITRSTSLKEKRKV